MRDRHPLPEIRRVRRVISSIKVQQIHVLKYYAPMLTRREFLTMLAAVAAAPIPPVRQVERLQRRGATQRVIVLGAGLAGLCTAYELQNLGHTVRSWKHKRDLAGASAHCASRTLRASTPRLARNRFQAPTISHNTTPANSA